MMVLLHAKPESKLEKRLEKLFSDARYAELLRDSQLRLHILIISTCSQNWKAYLNDMSETCLNQVRRVT